MIHKIQGKSKTPVKKQVLLVRIKCRGESLSLMCSELVQQNTETDLILKNSQLGKLHQQRDMRESMKDSPEMNETFCRLSRSSKKGKVTKLSALNQEQRCRNCTLSKFPKDLTHLTQLRQLVSRLETKSKE